MPKANPMATERTPRWSKQFDFTDGKDVDFSVTFRNVSDAAYSRFDEQASGKVAQYITGFGEPGSKGYVAPELLIGPGELPCESSFNYWLVACALSGSQVTEDENDRYTPEEWIMFMQNPKIALSASNAFAEMSAEGESLKGDES